MALFDSQYSLDQAYSPFTNNMVRPSGQQPLMAASLSPLGFEDKPFNSGGDPGLGKTLGGLSSLMSPQLQPGITSPFKKGDEELNQRPEGFISPMGGYAPSAFDPLGVGGRDQEILGDIRDPIPQPTMPTPTPMPPPGLDPLAGAPTTEMYERWSPEQRADWDRYGEFGDPSRNPLIEFPTPTPMPPPGLDPLAGAPTTEMYERWSPEQRADWDRYGEFGDPSRNPLIEFPTPTPMPTATLPPPAQPTMPTATPMPGDVGYVPYGSRNNQLVPPGYEKPSFVQGLAGGGPVGNLSFVELLRQTMEN